MIAPEIEPKLSEAQVRSAMLGHIASHCCYGKAAAKGMVIKKMEYLPAYHYELQTFTEKRETAWTYAAIRTGYESLLSHSSALGSGIPPLPWEIFEEPAQAFKDEVRLVQVKKALKKAVQHASHGFLQSLSTACVYIRRYLTPPAQSRVTAAEERVE